MLLKIVFFLLFFFTVFFYRLSRSFSSLLLSQFFCRFFFLHNFSISSATRIWSRTSKKGIKKLRWKVDRDFFLLCWAHAVQICINFFFLPRKDFFFLFCFSIHNFFHFRFRFGTRNTRKKTNTVFKIHAKKKKMNYYTSYKKTNKNKFSSLIESFRWKKFQHNFKFEIFVIFDFFFLNTFKAHKKRNKKLFLFLIEARTRNH